MAGHTGAIGVEFSPDKAAGLWLSLLMAVVPSFRWALLTAPPSASEVSDLPYVLVPMTVLGSMNPVKPAFTYIKPGSCKIMGVT